MENKKTVLLTGIAGSIGIHQFCRIMHSTDWNVVGVASFTHRGWADRIDLTLKEHPTWVPRLKMITHDLSSPFSDLTKKKIGHIDYIINLAATSDVEVSIQDPVTTIRNNIMSITYLLEYAREVKPEIFLQFSTDEVYGPTTGKNDGYKEWAPLVPSNPYAASKAAQEMIAIGYWRTYNIPLIITNTMNNFGEMQSRTKYPVMIQKWISNKEKIIIHGKNNDMGSRSYIHSGNVSEAVIFILKNCPPTLHISRKVDKPDRYNIAGDKQIDNLELVKLIANLMGEKNPDYELLDWHTARPGHDPHYGLDDSKLKNLGWKSPVSFEESLKNTIEWQSEHKEWIK